MDRHTFIKDKVGGSLRLYGCIESGIGSVDSIQKGGEIYFLTGEAQFFADMGPVRFHRIKGDLQ